MAESDDEQDLLRTLDREIFEELGLPSGFVSWEAKPWDRLFSIRGLEVTPFLGWVEGQATFRLAPLEVMRADWLPLADLVDDQMWSTRFLARRRPGRPIVATPVWEGWTFTTWGLTAGFLELFAARISGRAPY